MLAKAGAKIALLDINRDGVEAIARETGGVAVRCNVASTDAGLRVSRTAIWTLLTALSITACASAPQPDRRPRSHATNAIAGVLGPARWSIEFVATEGTHSGSRAVGTLTLLRTSVDDHSPLTGERASDEGIAMVPLYGALVSELAALGAQVNCGGHYPGIDSMDPVRPGVLVNAFPAASHLHPAARSTVLWIGSGSNIRNYRPNTTRVDEGCGAIMLITEMTAVSASGVWREAGIPRNGRGTFSARLIERLP